MQEGCSECKRETVLNVRVESREASVAQGAAAMLNNFQRMGREAESSRMLFPLRPKPLWSKRLLLFALRGRLSAASAPAPQSKHFDVDVRAAGLKKLVKRILKELLPSLK
eukprot:4126188-Pleurochrysis_carterae.AAC.3